MPDGPTEETRVEARLKEIEAASRQMMAILERLANEPDATSSLLAEIDRVLAAARKAGLKAS